MERDESTGAFMMVDDVLGNSLCHREACFRPLVVARFRARNGEHGQQLDAAIGIPRMCSAHLVSTGSSGVEFAGRSLRPCDGGMRLNEGERVRHVLCGVKRSLDFTGCDVSSHDGADRVLLEDGPIARSCPAFAVTAPDIANRPDGIPGSQDVAGFRERGPDVVHRNHAKIRVLDASRRVQSAGGIARSGLNPSYIRERPGAFLAYADRLCRGQRTLDISGLRLYPHDTMETGHVLGVIGEIGPRECRPRIH